VSSEAQFQKWTVCGIVKSFLSNDMQDFISVEFSPRYIFGKIVNVFSIAILVFLNCFFLMTNSSNKVFLITSPA